MADPPEPDRPAVRARRLSIPGMGGDMLSDKNGEGETSMSELVQKHMTNILFPVGERLNDLEDKLAATSKGLAAAIDRQEKAFGRMDRSDQKMSGLAGEIARAHEDLRGVHNELVEVYEKHATIDGEIDTTKAEVARTDIQQRSLASALRDVGKIHEEQDGRLRQVALSITHLESANVGLTDTINDVKSRYDGLNDRHLDLVKNVQDIKTSDENTRAALKRLSAAFEKQRKDDVRSFQQLDERSKGLEQGLLEAHNVLASHAKSLKSMSSKIGQVWNDSAPMTSRLSGDFSNEKAKDKEKLQQREQAKSSDLVSRIRELEEGLFDLGKKLDTEKAQLMVEVGTATDQVMKLSEAISRQNNDIGSLNSATSLIDSKLLKAEQRLSDCEAGTSFAKNDIARIDGDCRTLVAHVQKDVQQELGLHTQSLNKMDVSVKLTTEKLDATVQDVRDLSVEIGNMHQAVSKIRSSLDLAHEYFQGLTRGLSDTHRKVVASEGGILGSKVGPTSPAKSKGLPSLAGGGLRPMSAQTGATPRAFDSGGSRD